MKSLSVFEPALLKLINLVIKQKRNFSKDIEELMLKNEKYIYVKNSYEQLNAKVEELEEKLKELNKDSNSFNEALKGQLKAELKELLIERSKYYKMLATTYNTRAFVKRKRALLEKFNDPIEDINEFPFRDLFSGVTVLSPSEVVFHLGFIDHDIEKEPYLESTVPYIFRREKKTFTFYLVV